MRTITAKTPHDSSFSFSRRYFHWSTKNKPHDHLQYDNEIASKHSYDDDFYFENDNDDDDDEEVLNKAKRLAVSEDLSKRQGSAEPKKKKKKSTMSRILTLFRPGHVEKHVQPRRQLGTKVVGTLFGHRRGHVHFAFQEDPHVSPAFLIELAMPTSALVREMASGLVRIALECQRGSAPASAPAPAPRRPLIEEAVWRTYCNGRKCGYASRAECGPEEWKVLRAVGPITMGAGVIPGGGGGEGEGEVMYMRARFERVVGSKDSEAFYMMNPDGSGGPELSIYLLRV